MIQNTLNMEHSGQLLKSLTDPIRLEVIHTLAQGERFVCDLTGDLNLSQSKVSFHLRVFQEAGLLKGRQSSPWIYCHLKPNALTAVEAWLAGRAAQPLQPERSTMQKMTMDQRLFFSQPRNTNAEPSKYC